MLRFPPLVFLPPHTGLESKQAREAVQEIVWIWSS